MTTRSGRGLPPPRPGEVIRYAYLWSHERDEGREEAVKNRPSAVVLTIRRDEGGDEVLVLPITSSPPTGADAIEVPPGTCRRLGLRDEPCRIVLTEVNRFTWPGPDLRPVERPATAGLPFYSYGLLPAALFARVRDAVVARAGRRKLRAVRRTE